MRQSLEISRVATFQSPFKSLFGTPRQGVAAPSTRGRIVLEPRMEKEYLQELDSFSHIWVLFVFDRNNENYKAKPTARPPRF